MKKQGDENDMGLSKKIKLSLLFSCAIMAPVATTTSCWGSQSKSTHQTFDEFKTAVEKESLINIVKNGKPILWAGATASQLSAYKTGFQVADNNNVSIKIIYNNNQGAKISNFIIYYKNDKTYNVKNWESGQVSNYISFADFLKAAQNTDILDIVKNANPQLWPGATKGELSELSSGFVAKANVSVSIGIIYNKQTISTFTIKYAENTYYDLKNWASSKPTEYTSFADYQKAINNIGDAKKIWSSIWDYKKTHKGIELPNINFQTPAVDYQAHFLVDKTTLSNNGKTFTLKIEIIKKGIDIYVPKFTYNLNITATWTGAVFSMNDWTSNYTFDEYTTSMTALLTYHEYAKKYLSLGSDFTIGHPIIEKDANAISVTYTKKDESKILVATMDIENSKNRLFGYLDFKPNSDPDKSDVRELK